MDSIRRSTALALLLFALAQLGACHFHSPLPPPVDVERAQCDPDQGSADCARQVEAQQLRKAGELVRRQGNKVCFRLARGDEACVADEEPSESEIKLFSYLGTFAAPRYHVLWAQYYEGNSILLINAANGTQVAVDAIPVPSPDAAYLAVASTDMGAAYNPTRFSIWSVNGHNLKQVWEIEPEDWGPGTVRWIGDSTLEVRRLRRDPETFEPLPADTVRVEVRDASWHLVQSP